MIPSLFRILQVLRDRKHKEAMADASYWDERAKARSGYARSVWHSQTFSAAWDERQRSILRKALTHTLGDVHGKRIADIGCGTGRITRFLSREGAHAVGFDFSPITIQTAREETRAEGLSATFEVSDISGGELPATPASFDAALSVGCLAVACRDSVSLENALRAIAQSVKVGAPVFLLEPIHTTRFFGRVLRAPLAEWVACGARAGLSLAEQSAMGFLPVRLALASFDFPPWLVNPVFMAGEYALDSFDIGNKIADYSFLQFRKLTRWATLVRIA